jgi:molybdopterin-guanine dinucleotide biosynthesis adapter protein
MRFFCNLLSRAFLLEGSYQDRSQVFSEKSNKAGSEDQQDPFYCLVSAYLFQHRSILPKKGFSCKADTSGSSFSLTIGVMKFYTDHVHTRYQNVVSFVARGTKSGKTYLLEQVIREMKQRGRKITAVKHAMHQHVVDEEGKDTFKFAQNGADRIILFSPEGMLMYEAGHPDIEYVFASAAHSIDLILVEGFKNGPFRKIEVFNEELYATPLCLEQPDSQYIAIVSRGPLNITIPQFRFEEIPAICDFIETCAGLR